MTTRYEVNTENIEKIVVEKFTTSIRYVILITIKRTIQRIVIVYSIKTTKFTVVEEPKTIKPGKPVVLEQKVESDGTKVTTSNTVEQVQAVDTKVEKFIQTLSQQVPVEPSQITSITSKQSTSNTNEYTIFVRNEKTTS